LLAGDLWRDDGLDLTLFVSFFRERRRGNSELFLKKRNGGLKVRTVDPPRGASLHAALT
jgi:hypothetical protein